MKYIGLKDKDFFYRTISEQESYTGFSGYPEGNKYCPYILSILYPAITLSRESLTKIRLCGFFLFFKSF